MNTIEELRFRFGGKFVCDPYPYVLPDCNLWVELLSLAMTKSIGLYGTLLKIRGIGATLEKSDSFGYTIKPIIKGVNGRWGWASEKVWQEEKKSLLPYLDTLKILLKEIGK